MAEVQQEPNEDKQVPPPTPDETVEGSDSLAEEIALSAGLNLKSARTKRELDRLLRQARVESHLHRLVVCGLYLIAISASFMFLALVYHYLSPYPFLTEPQLTDLKQLLFSGAVGAGASGLAKKYLAITRDARE